MPRPVFHITRILPSYRVPVLEALNERLDGRLVVGHGQPPEGSSLGSLVEDSSPAFEQIELPNYWLRGESLHAQRYGPIFGTYGPPSVVLAEESPRSVSLPFLLRHAKKQGARRVLWGHFSSNKRVFSPWHPLDRYRLEMARRVEACVCYSRPIAETLSDHLPEDRLFVARNTIDTDHLFPLYDELAAKGKETVRRSVDLPTDEPVLLFLGRLIERKGVELLLDTFAAFRRERQATLCIIGDGAERETLERKVAAESIPDVRFLGAITDNEALAPYLYSADTMVIPGYLGLVVNDAFAFGLPVISRQAPPDKRFHSPEIAYVESGVNGILTPWDDRTALVEAIHEVLDNQQEYSRNAYRYAREHLTMDRMVDGLAAAITFAEQSSL